MELMYAICNPSDASVLSSPFGAKTPALSVTSHPVTSFTNPPGTCAGLSKEGFSTRSTRDLPLLGSRLSRHAVGELLGGVVGSGVWTLGKGVGTGVGRAVGCLDGAAEGSGDGDGVVVLTGEVCVAVGLEVGDGNGALVVVDVLVMVLVVS